MFGLFNSKKSVKTDTTVAPEVGAVLQPHAAVPAQLPPPVTLAHPECKLAHLRGLPPEGQWVPDEVLGETRRVYILPAAAGQPPLAISAENYVYQDDHVVLFSLRHPQGLEILKLNIDNGNVRAWAVQGKSLWLQTLDRRKKPVDFSWSLDLSKVL